MMSYAVDTNVLLVASAAHPYSTFDDTHLAPSEQLVVFEWLAAFRADDTRYLVLDEFFRIYEEYRHELNEQDYGLQVVHAKLETCRYTLPVAYDQDGYGVIPEALSPVDNSDKKFVAAALNDPARIQIVNACDSDWRKQRALLEAHGVRVLELLP